MVFRFRYRLVRLAVSAIIAAGIIGYRSLHPKIQSLSTTSTSVPDLYSHTYDVPQSMAANFAAQFAVRKLGWTVKGTDPATNTVVLEASRFGGSQTDTLTVACKPAANPRYVTVDVTAIGTFGELQHIRALQAGMDDKLPTAPGTIPAP